MERLGYAMQAVALRYQHTMRERDQVIAERLGVLMCAADETQASSNVVALSGVQDGA